jgi:GH3 auxin-responsive promoter
MLLRFGYLAWVRFRLKRFQADARRAREFQHRALLAKIRRNANSDFGRDHAFSNICTVQDFRRRQPIAGYDEHHPYIKRVLNGEVTALFAPGTRILMFAMTSGTTGTPKRLPITEELFHEYASGWKIWGAGVYGDHLDLMNKQTLQLSSDWQQFHAPSGVPCGQISGLAATTRPWITQRMFLLPRTISQIHDPAAKHYASLRFALACKDVGMVVTANPSTLIEFARRADREKESLIRDIYDGSLSCDLPEHVRRTLARKILSRNPQRARELDRLASQHGRLLPRHAWPGLKVLAVWMGGSVNVYLSQLPEYYGEVELRDHGLSASEGRMTIPISPGTSAGLLDFYHHYFEFIPVEEHDRARPTVLEGHELVEGRDYYIVMTTSGGLYRYDIQDVVRCVGFVGQAPLIEFLNKGKNFSNLTGEKLSEHQAIRAVKKSFAELGLPLDTFTLTPVMDEQPRYVLLVEHSAHRGRVDELAHRVQSNLAAVNEEYGSKCTSGRLLPVQVREVAPGTWHSLRSARTSDRGNFEEYKHPCLVGDISFAERISRIPVHAP